MKTRLFLSIALFCAVFASLSSCSSDDDITPDVTNGTPGAGWKVSSFTEPKEDKTNDFSGYILEFADNGIVNISGNGKTIAGTWKQFQNDGVTKFQIALSTTDHDLSSLNHDWVIVSKTDKLISLKDDNAASNEVLQFTKN